MRATLKPSRAGLAAALVLLLAGCQFADETLWPKDPPEGIAPRAETQVPQALLKGRSERAPGAVEAEPLMVIRSDRPETAYRTPLSQTVGEVLRLRPKARFDLVAVRPGQGDPADLAQANDETQRQAERILGQLTDLGLPAERVALTATTNLAANFGEVHLYLR